MNKTRWLVVALMVVGTASSACAATWTNTLADGNINDAANWSGGLPNNSTGVGAVVAGTPLVINQVYTGGDGDSQYLVTGSGGLTIADGGSFRYFGDGLLGATAFGAGGASVINQTGGSLTQDGGGAGMLIGYDAIGTYNISGGNLTIEPTAPSLTIDYNLAADAASDSSSLNISGTGQVDVEAGVNLLINAGGTLDITDDGLLIWHDRLVADAVFPGTVNAPFITQMGDDVWFSATDPTIAIPEPGTFVLAALGLLGLGWFGCRKRK